MYNVIIENVQKQEGKKLHKGMTFLFQGDSITDGGRKRSMDANHILGHGYQYIVSAKLALEYCSCGFKFINKGVTGEAIENIYARLKKDVTIYKPDVVSFLAGANDIERGVGREHGTVTDDYINIYADMIHDLRAELPDTVIMICEPFYVETDNYNEPYKNSPHVMCEEYFKPLNIPKNDKHIKWKSEEIKLMQTALAQFAAENRCIYVPLQKEFDRYCKKASAEYFVWDCIHPTVAGHEIIAENWLSAANKYILKKEY